MQNHVYKAARYFRGIGISTGHAIRLAMREQRISREDWGWVEALVLRRMREV